MGVGREGGVLWYAEAKKLGVFHGVLVLMGKIDGEENVDIDDVDSFDN